MPTVFNSRSKSEVPIDAVYVGRPTKWGNPFIVGRDGTREECIEKYTEYVNSNQHLLGALIELRGRDLVCWCAPKSCHADVLLALANRDE